MDAKHSHYKKDVTGLNMIDVYRVLDLFGVTDPCIQHAAKKLLATGVRGHKDAGRDIQDAIDTLERWKEMRAEDRQRQSDRHPMTPNVVEYSGKTPDIETLSISLVEKGPDSRCRILDGESASQMQDDSPRMAAIGQNGNGGEHYRESPIPKPILAMATGLSRDQLASMIDGITTGVLFEFAVTSVHGDAVELTQVFRVAP